MTAQRPSRRDTIDGRRRRLVLAKTWSFGDGRNASVSDVPPTDEARFSFGNTPQRRRRPLSVALFIMRHGAVGANWDVVRQLQLDAAANSAHHLALRTTAPANTCHARRWTPLAHDNRRLIFLLPRVVQRVCRTTLAQDRGPGKIVEIDESKFGSASTILLIG